MLNDVAVSPQGTLSRHLVNIITENECCDCVYAGVTSVLINILVYFHF